MQSYFVLNDGDTNSPTYNGIIGSLIKDGLDLQQPIKFKKVRGKVKDYTDDPGFLASLNSDMELLYKYCLALQSGKLPDGLANRIPGKIHKAR